MIKFFRHIRKSLLMENKTGKYLKYAIGEIILVVIGILIALQINNWNEDKKEQVVEKKILRELLIDLEISKRDLENDIKVNKRYQITAEALKEHLHFKKAYHDSIEVMLITSSSITQFTPRTTGYQNLNSVGFSIISNDSLRKQISNVFERNFDNAKLRGREFNKTENATEDLNPYLIKHFKVDFDSEYDSNNNNYQYTTHKIKIRDYQELLNEKHLVLIIQKSIYDRASKLITYISTLKKINQVSGMIEQELKRLEND